MKVANGWQADEMTIVYVECPYCGKNLEIYFNPNMSEGDEIKCYKCGKHAKLGKEEE